MLVTVYRSTALYCTLQKHHLKNIHNNHDVVTTKRDNDNNYHCCTTIAIQAVQAKPLVVRPTALF